MTFVACFPRIPNQLRARNRKRTNLLHSALQLSLRGALLGMFTPLWNWIWCKQVSIHGRLGYVLREWIPFSLRVDSVLLLDRMLYGTEWADNCSCLILCCHISASFGRLEISSQVDNSGIVLNSSVILLLLDLFHVPILETMSVSPSTQNDARQETARRASKNL